MKSLFSILGLSFLSLTLTNCSLSPEQIAFRLKPSNEVSLVSAKGVEYRKLRDLLKAKKWKDADEETHKRMLEVAGRDSQGIRFLRREDVENFPCQDLGTIDKLWVKHSDGKFGFSVQKQIYQDLGGTGTKDYDYKVWLSFQDKVGWHWIGIEHYDVSYSDSNLENHYIGHLPGEAWVRHSDRWVYGVLGMVLFSRAETCIL